MIVIGDDMKANVTLLRTILQDTYDLCWAFDGETALALVKEELPDLILLDIVMRDVDGYGMCKRLKADSETFDIPVIFITVRSAEEDETRGFHLGVVDYITKPFNLEELTEVISRQITA